MLYNFFNSVYIISLIDSLERRRVISNNLNKIGLKYEFINAINYLDLDINNLEKNELIAYEGNKFYCNKKCTCKGSGHYLRPSSIANQLSHEIAWKKSIKNNENILILEDDVIINKNFIFDLQLYENELPKKWDLIYLSKNGNHNFPNKFTKLERGVSGSHMYAITSKSCSIALKNLYPIRAHVDGYLDRFLIKKNSFLKKPLLKHCYITDKKLGINSSIDSNIESTMTRG